MDVNVDATADEHCEALQRYGEAYLSKVLKRNAPAITRQRVLIASLRYLENRLRTNDAVASASQLSQASQALGLSQAAAAAGPTSSFQSLLASALDQDIPTEILMEACAKAADSQLLPILVKCLGILSTTGSIREDDVKEAEKGVGSPSQYEDEDLFGAAVQDSDEENINPQHGRSERPASLASRPNCGKRKGIPREVSVGRTGQSFVDEFVSKLVADESSKSGTQGRSADIFVSTVAKEAPLSEAASRNVLLLLARRMRRVDVFELPPFIYQLLLFASARGTAASKSQVLMQISQVFTELEKKAKHADALSQNILEEDEDAILSSSLSMRDLRQVQGTALLHIEYAVKQDPSLSVEILKLAKAGVEAPQQFLSPFGVGIMLSLTRTSSSHSHILHALREAVVRHRREILRRDSNLYAARVSMNDEKVLHPGKSLLHVADCTCETGWDSVKEGLLQFSLLLLDKPVVDNPTSVSEHDQLREQLLYKLFKAHSAIRQSILEQLTTRIALQEKSAYPCISIIQTLAIETPFNVLEHNHNIRDGIELLPSLPPWLATALAMAYRPLLAARQALRDYFQLVIRKSLFHRDSSSRAVAIDGFLLVVSLVSSTKRAEEHISSKTPSIANGQEEQNIDDVLEAVQPLRRIFSYPAPLRAALYKNTIHSLQNADERQSSRMAAALDEVLRDHLRVFVSPREPPYIVLEHCVNESIGGWLVEPLGDLIRCLAVVESKRDPQMYNKSYIIDLARKVASVSIQDFSVTKEQLTASHGNAQSAQEDEGAPHAEEATARANRNRIRVLGSICEALIHSILIIRPEAQDWTLFTEMLIPLLTLKGKVFDILSKTGVSSPGDAFMDFGGDLHIERLRPAMRMHLQRVAKTNPQHKKKGTIGRKGKHADVEQSSVTGAQLVSDHRFGSFSVLSSASSKPTLPLEVAMRTLRAMSDAISQAGSSIRNVFHGQVETRDFKELRTYLLAVVQKHVEEFISSTCKGFYSEPIGPDGEPSVMGKTLNDLVQMAMNDFKRFRRSASPANAHPAIAVLQIAERCACAMMYAAKGDKAAVAAFCEALMPVKDLETNSPEESFEAAAEALEQLAESLIDDESFKEAGLTLRMHNSLTQGIFDVLSTVEKRSAFVDKRIRWATGLVALRQVRDSSIVKTLVSVCLRYTANNNDLRRAGFLCQRLLAVIGNCDENVEPSEKPGDDEEKLCSAMCIQQETSLVVVDVVLDVVDTAICDVEWCLGRMLSLESAVGNSSVECDSNSKEKNEERHALLQEVAAKQAIRAEDAAQVRLEGIVRTLAGLSRCAIGKWVQQERLVKLITKTYKVACSATQAQVKRRGDPRTTFTSLINECKALAPSLWTYLSFMGTIDQDEQGSKGPSRAVREARIMPQLIYEVEKFEKVLIAAQKRTKINLLRGMRRNIARDFRIREDLLHEQEDLDEAGDADELGNDIPSGTVARLDEEPASKRPRT